MPVPSDAAFGEFLQLCVLRRGVDEERRVKLLQHVTVLLEQKAEDLLHVMVHDVHLQPVDHALVLDRLFPYLQFHDQVQRQHMPRANRNPSAATENRTDAPR
jgi:hypothetical protein